MKWRSFRTVFIWNVQFSFSARGVVGTAAGLEEVMPLFILPGYGHGRRTIDTVARYYGDGNTFITCVGVADTDTVIM